MADLLECLIQIKALRETISRVEAACTAAAAGDRVRERIRQTVASLVEREARWQQLLRQALPSSMTDRMNVSAPPDASSDVLLAFTRGRSSTLGVLDACTAQQLAAAAPLPERPNATLADVIAIMLAGDAERLGEIRRLVEEQPPGSR